MASKVTPRLAEQVADRRDNDKFDVVVELQPQSPPTAGSRVERVRALKNAFEQSATDVRRRIGELGGEVVDVAWLNKTLLTKLPKRALARLEDDERIVALDTPRMIVAEGEGEG
jgi:hypothetical protein